MTDKKYMSITHRDGFWVVNIPDTEKQPHLRDFMKKDGQTIKQRMWELLEAVNAECTLPPQLQELYYGIEDDLK